MNKLYPYKSTAIERKNYWLRKTRWTTLLAVFALLAGIITGCDNGLADQDLQDEADQAAADSVGRHEVIPRRDPGASKAGDRAHWADGYVWAENPTASSYTPNSYYSFNRSGGAVTITKPAGTTGRYVVRFTGLSAFLGGTSTVRVSALSAADSYCKPVTPRLVNDAVEVRCFDMSSKTPIDTYYSVMVTRNYTDIAYAHAHQPTMTNYAPASVASWNPAGAIRIFRVAKGAYEVVFKGLGNGLSNGGSFQINSVGTGDQHCKMGYWTIGNDVNINVQCYNAAGAFSDSKFNVLFLQPSDRLGYTWASEPSVGEYFPNTYYSSNPSGTDPYIYRLGVGSYRVILNGIDPYVIEGGNAQVTAYGPGNTQCKLFTWGFQSVEVRCFKPDGQPEDSNYTVMLGS